MTDPTELDELESGLTSGFWARLSAYAHREWGPVGQTYLQAIQRAVTGPVGSEADAVQRLKVVMAQHDAVMRLLQWPSERVAALKRGQHAAEMAGTGSRRGPGL